LWRVGQAQDLKPARQAVLLTLVKMAEGGLYDQLGGGFHRYSVDDHWGVPHFEKMLYDNALLLRLYSEVLLSGSYSSAPSDAVLAPDVRALFLEVISETVEYLLREMTSPAGAFYSAQDADSEGEEGRFFAWSSAELDQVLTLAEARIFKLRYGVTPEGNFEHATTVLHLSRSLQEISQETGVSEVEVRENLAFACAKLREVRSRRVAPGLDDKILVSWNGMLISGLAWASRALEAGGRMALAHRASFAAHRAFDWLSDKAASDPGGRIHAVLSEEGEARISGRLDDSAFLIQGGLDLLRFLPESGTQGRLSARFNAVKKKVCVLAESAWQSFADPESKGFYLSGPEHADLILRPLSLNDQAIPAGAAVFLESLLELDALGIEGAWSADLEERVLAVRERVFKNPFGLASLGVAVLKHALGTVVLKGAGSSRFQGHFSLIQEISDQVVGDLQFCHEKTCEPLAGSTDVVWTRLRQALAPGLQPFRT
jgi:uncharacterized protein YyaL (SSP411 family)